MKLDITKAYLITEAGDVNEIRPLNDTDFQLSELQRYVDGYIEILYLPDGRIMVLNEEGKFYKDLNIPATELAIGYGVIQQSDYISGDVILCPSAMVK